MTGALEITFFPFASHVSLFVAWRVCCHFLKSFDRERYFCFFTVLLALNIHAGLIQAIQVFTSDKHCPVPYGSLHSQWRGINSFTAIYWDKTSTITAEVVLESCIPPIPCSCEQLRAVSCCCFWSFPQLLLEFSSAAPWNWYDACQVCYWSASSDQQPLKMRSWWSPCTQQRCWARDSCVQQRCAVLRGWHSLWVPQLRELLPSALWELNSSKCKLRIGMCEQHLPGKAFDLPWVSQQEEFSSLELLPSSDHDTLNFCSAEQFLPPHSLFPLTVLWLPRGLKPLWWGGIQRFSYLWLRVALRASFSLLFW